MSGVLATDTAALAAFTEDRERRLSRLPARRERSAGQARAAAEIHAECRSLRRAFLAVHTDAVHDELTAKRTTHPRMGPLVLAAGQRFPGLAPTPAQMAAERALIQAHKEGREIDQALFLAAVLDSPTAGDHLIGSMRLPTPGALERLAGFRADGLVRFETLTLERRGPAAHVTFENQRCLNAEDDRLVADLEEAVDLALLDDQVRVGVLRGGVQTHPRHAGRRIFSAGINLSDLRNGRISFTDFLMSRELGCLTKLVHGLLTAPGPHRGAGTRLSKPWIAAVDGFAIGGGMQLLLTADWVIAARDAYFSLPAAQEGIVPGLSALRLGRLVGARAARRIILAGHTVRATDPAAGSLCDEVTEPEAVDEAVQRAVALLDSPAVVANRIMLGVAEEPLAQLRSFAAQFALVQAERLYSADVVDKVERRWAARRNIGDAA